jgi:hypothetical protein
MPDLLIPLFAVALAAAPQPASTPSQIAAISACRSITDSQARLACYDNAVQQLQQAIASKDLTVLSRSDVRQSRRSLFGFTVPRLPFLGGDEGDEKQIVSKVARIRSTGYGKWEFRLEDGAVWETTEPTLEGEAPSSGQNVTIKRGVLGNYFILFPGLRAVRGRRIS